MPRVEHIGDATLFLGDCREIVQGLARTDLILTDPPYGIGADTAQAKRAGIQSGRAAAPSRDYGDSNWDSSPPDQKTIDALRSWSRFQIIWGGNYFNLPPSQKWLVWNKKTDGNRYADCELAWTNLPGSVRMFNFRWMGMLQEDQRGKELRVHPTQKPVALMEWCLDQAPQAETILDPYMGSGSAGVAAMNQGRKFIGVEIEERYFDIAVERIAESASQVKMDFMVRPEPDQTIIHMEDDHE